MMTKSSLHIVLDYGETIFFVNHNSSLVCNSRLSLANVWHACDLLRLGIDVVIAFGVVIRLQRYVIPVRLPF